MLRRVWLLSLSFTLCCQLVTAQQPLLVPIKTGMPDQNRVNIVYPANDGYLYLGSGAEVYRFNGINSELLGQLPDAQTVFTSFFSYRDELWLGSSNGKIYLLRQGKLRLFAPQEGLPGAAITHFASDAAGQLWIATQGEGVYCWTGKRFYQFGTDDGMPDAVVNQLLFWNNQIWAATDGGLLQLSLQQGQKKLTVYTTEQGLPDNIITQLAAFGQQLVLGFESTGPGLFDTKKYSPIAVPTTQAGVIALQIHADEMWWVTTDQHLFIYDLLRDKSRSVTIALPEKKPEYIR